MEGAGAGGAGAEEDAEALDVSASVVVEGFADGIFTRGACLLLRCPATSLVAGAAACRRCTACIAREGEIKIRKRREAALVASSKFEERRCL